MCSPDRVVVLHTTSPSLSGLQSPPVRWSDKLSHLFPVDKLPLWLMLFPSPSMRFQGMCHFNGLMARLRDTVSLKSVFLSTWLIALLPTAFCVL